MNLTVAAPQRVLVVGSSGAIGRRLIRQLCGDPGLPIARVTYLERDRGVRYNIADSGHLELAKQNSLLPWLDHDPNVVVYLAGVHAQAACSQIDLAHEIHVTAFGRMLSSIETKRRSITVLYASSTAVHAPSDGTYAVQKIAAERVLTASGIPGAALRFPTVLPRNSARDRTGLLNAPFREALRGEMSIWPIRTGRVIRVMSAPAAVRHIVAGLSIQRFDQALTLDLPATLVTPCSICEAAGAPEPQSDVDEQFDGLLARRIVDIPTQAALDLGFPEPESLADLVTELKTAFNP